jgi:Ca2+/Na+ antiporter
LSVNESRAFEAPISITDSDPNVEKEKAGFVRELLNEIADPEAGALENLILMPLLTCGLLVVCYLENPIMKTIGKYFLVAASYVWIITIMEIYEAPFLYVCAVGLGIGIICCVLEILKVSENGMSIFYEILSVFAAIAFISVFSGLIIDFITFLAFYFSIDEVILNTMLLSIGNTLGDFFGNGALAKAGQGVMGGFASYSG